MLTSQAPKQAYDKLQIELVHSFIEPTNWSIFSWYAKQWLNLVATKFAHLDTNINDKWQNQFHLT